MGTNILGSGDTFFTFLLINYNLKGTPPLSKITQQFINYIHGGLSQQNLTTLHAIFPLIIGTMLASSSTLNEKISFQGDQ